MKVTKRRNIYKQQNAISGAVQLHSFRSQEWFLSQIPKINETNSLIYATIVHNMIDCIKNALNNEMIHTTV